MHQEYNVRYVGPTTHLNDHRLVHAAKGLSHVWTASVVAGLAVVLTGVMAYASVQAEAAKVTAKVSDPAKLEVQRLTQRLDVLEAKLQRLVQRLEEPVRVLVPSDEVPAGIR